MANATRPLMNSNIVQLAELASQPQHVDAVKRELAYRRTPKAHKLAEALGCSAKAPRKRSAAKAPKRAKAPKAGKRERTPAQRAATERMRKARAESLAAKTSAKAFPADAMSSGGSVGDFADIAHHVEPKGAGALAEARRLMTRINALMSASA